MLKININMIVLVKQYIIVHIIYIVHIEDIYTSRFFFSLARASLRANHLYVVHTYHIYLSAKHLLSIASVRIFSDSLRFFTTHNSQLLTDRLWGLKLPIENNSESLNCKFCEGWDLLLYVEVEHYGTFHQLELLGLSLL